MNRLLRILLNTTTALSFLLCVTAVFFWIRSYYSFDGLTHTHLIARDGVPLRRVVDIDASLGRIGLGIGYISVSLFQTIDKGIPNYPPPHIVWSHFGFRHRRLSYQVMPHILEMWYLEVPFWFLTLAFALAPARWSMKRFRSARRSSSICPNCGYDMRATPQRCPECGTPAALPVAAMRQ